MEIREFLGQDPWAVENTPLYCVTPYGLLGAGGMMNGVWQVDYGAGEITVASSVDQLEHIDGAITVPFTPQPGLSPTPLVELPVGNGKLLFIVDTGGGELVLQSTPPMPPRSVLRSAKTRRRRLAWPQARQAPSNRPRLS